MSSKLVRQAKQLLISGAIITISVGTLPVQAQVSSRQVAALVEALRKAAPQTGRADDGLYSEWQIKPENIPRWSRLCTGQAMTVQQFEANTAKAREILACVVQDVLRDEYKASGNNESVAVQRAACWWMTGDPNQCQSGATATYTKKVLDFYQQQVGNAQSQAPATPSRQPASKPATPPPANQAKPKPQSSVAPTANPEQSAQPATTQSKPVARSSSTIPISDAQVGMLVESLRQAAPQTDTAKDGLYSDWQVKADNIPRWSEQCLGRELTPTQFQDSPVTARAILVCVMRDVMREQYSASNSNEFVAVQRAAAWWMTGDPTQYENASTAPFAQKVLDFYKQSRMKFFSHI